MALPVTKGLPIGMVLTGDYTIRFDAVDPTTGADVANVVITRASILTEEGETVPLKPTDKFQYVYQAADGSQVTGGAPTATAGGTAGA